MRTYNIPRNYRGESRILFIFSPKGLIYTVVGLLIGLIFYFIFNIIGLTTIGIICDVITAGIGYCIGTFKIPDTRRFELTRKTGGENIDNVIKRWFKFKTGGKRVYIYRGEETKDEQ